IRVLSRSSGGMISSGSPWSAHYRQYRNRLRRRVAAGTVFLQASALAGHMLRLALALGRSEVAKLLLGHGFLHALRRALQVALVGLATLGRKGRARRLLLCLRFCRHVCLLR